MIIALSLFSLAVTFAACGGQPQPVNTSNTENNTMTASVKKESFGKLADGTDVDSYTLTNKNGVQVKITNYGATVTSIKVPDRNGKFDDVVLGYDSIDGYLAKNPHLGAVAGRYANRIAKGQFTLDGKTYTLAKNNGENHLHGGPKGFYQALWTATPVERGDGVAVMLKYLSKDGEENYPGNLDVTVTYTLTDRNELKIDYAATTDKDTILNLTNHSYFNLAGAGNGDILNHQLRINADQITPVDKTMIPTGDVKPVAGTPFDFSKLTPIGARINDPDEQLVIGKGYDHNFILKTSNTLSTPAVEVYEPTAGRVMEVFTDQPGVQLYTGNFLDGSITGKGGKVYNQRYGFCLETQHYPDSPNHPNFPTVVLKPGQQFASTTIFKFSAR
jgi:aldose 1-epimerase